MMSAGFCFGQTIDSVVVRHCTYIEDNTDSTFEIMVDSFDVNGLLINSYNYDTNWNVKGRVFCNYSASNLLLNKTTQLFDSLTWTTFTEIMNQYDLNDSLIESDDNHYYYYMGALTDSICYRNSYTRDTVNHSLTWRFYQYIDSSNTWFNYGTYTFYSDSLNRKSLQVHESGTSSIVDSTWYFYLANDSLDYYLTKSSSLDKFQCIYNLQDYLIMIIDSTWNVQPQRWYPTWLNQYYRDTNNNIIAYSRHQTDTLGNIDQAGDTSTYQYNSLNQEIFHWSRYYTAGGDYSITAYDSIGILLQKNYCSYGHGGGQHCTDCDYNYFTYPFTTGIHLANNNQETTIIIFPNPTANTFNVQNISSRNTTLIQILNPLGEIIYNEKFFGRTECIVHSNLPSGIYFVCVSDGERNVVKKLIVE